MLGLAWGAGQAAAAEAVDPFALSPEQLLDATVTSVSKASEKLGDAPAAVYVITAEDIARSGATSLGDILRLAPNLQVAAMGASGYAITARGFNGNAADKLLVLIDGRSIYTPLYGGVLWDEKDVLPQDIERIEVISGPGASLWGANAVNGVINIITRKSADTQGGVLDLGAGDRESRASLQYGGALADDLHYRVYGEAFAIPHGKTSDGADAADGWNKAQGGFRLDWTPATDTLTLQGDLYGGAEGPSPAAQDIRGGNIQATWRHVLEDGSSLQVLGYYDATRRYSGPYGYSLDTYDLELQHDFSWGSRQSIVWGGGVRAYRDRFSLAGAPVQFLPDRRRVGLADIFAQDSIGLAPSLKLTAGLKLEADPYAALEFLPSLRLSWKPDDNTLLWAAVSRAIRAPTRFDVDLSDTIIPSVLILTGAQDFQPETLIAYEAGAKLQIGDSASLSVSGFYNAYDDLRSTEWLNMTTLPLLWTYGNMMKGHVYGIELWGDYRPRDWWRLTAGFNLQQENLGFKPASAALGGTRRNSDGGRRSPSSGVAAVGDEFGRQPDLGRGPALGRTAAGPKGAGLCRTRYKAGVESFRLAGNLTLGFQLAACTPSGI
jgi:iron complex outermembrane receptor protein